MEKLSHLLASSLSLFLWLKHVLLSININFGEYFIRKIINTIIVRHPPLAFIMLLLVFIFREEKQRILAIHGCVVGCGDGEMLYKRELVY